MNTATKLLIGALFFSAILVLAVAIWNFFKAQRLERSQQKEDQRRQKQLLLEFWQSKAEQIIAARQQFQSFLRPDNGYFANYLLTSWKEKYASLLKHIKNKPSSGIGIDPELEKDIATIHKCFNDGEDIRRQFNQKFVAKE